MSHPLAGPADTGTEPHRRGCCQRGAGNIEPGDHDEGMRDRDTSGITYHVLQESLAGLFAQLDHHLSENHCNVRESRTNKIAIEDYISVVLSFSNLSYVWQM